MVPASLQRKTRGRARVLLERELYEPDARFRARAVRRGAPARRLNSVGWGPAGR